MEYVEAKTFLHQIDAVSLMDEAEREYIFTLAQNINDPIAEVGCCYGGTSILMALASHAEIYAIDNGAASNQEETCRRNIENSGCKDSIHFIQEEADLSANAFANEYFGLVFIDADHEREHPYLDLTAWAPKLKKGGYLLIDDFSVGYPGVTRGVVRFLTEHHNFTYVTSFERVSGPHRQVKLLVLQKNMI